MIFLLILGLFLVTVGLLGVLSDKFDEWIEQNVRTRFEPNRDERNKNRWFNRYWGGFKGIITGIFLLLVYLMYFLFDVLECERCHAPFDFLSRMIFGY